MGALGRAAVGRGRVGSAGGRRAGPTHSSRAATGCSTASDPSVGTARSDPTSPPATRQTRRACPSASTFPRTSLGREAILAARRSVLSMRLRTLLVGDQDYLPIYGGEAVRSRWARGRARAELCVRVHRADGPSRSRTSLSTLGEGTARGRGLRRLVAAEVAAERAATIPGQASKELMDRPTIEQVLSQGEDVRGQGGRGLPALGGPDQRQLPRRRRRDEIRRQDPRSLDRAACGRPGERAAQRSAAATTGVSPRVVEVLREWDVMVLEFVEGADDDRGAASFARAGQTHLRFAQTAPHGPPFPQGLRHVPAD